MVLCKECRKGGKILRLDKYLKVSRLIKRRSVANEMCDLGRVSIDGRVVRASYEVKVGDHLRIDFGTRQLLVEILAVAETIGKAEASTLYRELPEV